MINKILKNSFIAIGFAEIITFAYVIIRNKFISVYFGPSGFGMFSLLNSFFLLLTVFTGAWVQTGTTKLLAEYFNDKPKRNFLVSFSILITFVLSVIVIIICLIFANQIKTTFLSPDITLTYFLIFTFSLIGISVKPVVYSVFQGLLQFRYVSVVKIINAIFDIGLLIVLGYYMGLDGVFYSFLISNIIALLIYIYLLREYIILKNLVSNLNRELIIKYFKFGSSNFVLTVIDYFSQFFIRNITEKNLGLTYNGILQSNISIMNYLSTPNRLIFFKYFPQIAGNITHDEKKTIFLDNLQKIYFFNIPIFIFFVAFNTEITQLFFSSAFITDNISGKVFIIAQYFFCIAEFLQATMIACSQLKKHTINTIIIHSLWIIIPLLLIDTLGFYTFPIMFLFTGILKLILYNNFGSNLFKKDFKLNFQFWFPVVLFALLLIDFSTVIRALIFTVSIGGFLFYYFYIKKLKLSQLVS